MQHEDAEEIPDFSSRDDAARRRWTEKIIRLHHRQLEELPRTQARLAKQGLGKRQLDHYTTRITATRNSLESWEAYQAEGCPRDPGAPAIRPLSRYV